MPQQRSKDDELNRTLLRPVRLPRVRDRLARHWRDQPLARAALSNVPDENVCWLPGECIDRPDEFAAMQHGPVTVEHADRFCRFMADSLADADLFWISDEFTQLAADAAADLPHVTVDREHMPAPSGIVFFERAATDNHWNDVYHGTPVSGVASVDAISWTSTPHGVWMTMYAIVDKVIPDQPADRLRDQIGYLLAHAPGGGLIFGEHQDISTASPHVALLLATWLLLEQPGVAEVNEGPADKDAARTYKRNGRRYPDVRVVNLRRRPVPEGGVAPEPGRTYHVRWVRRGHWRRQPYGPRRSLTRMIYIAAHLCGPDGAPIKDSSATVKKLS